MKDGELGRVYADGEVICKEGDMGDVMYAIQSGTVKISKLSGGKEQTFIILGRGDLFGEMALFDRQPRSATATALGEARVLSIDKKKLFTSISRDPTLVFKLLETMSQRMRRLSDDVVRLSGGKVGSL
jgi:CRP/FNR family transcriptional regulator